MSRIDRVRAHARVWTIKFAQVYLSVYVAWLIGAAIDRYDWPAMGWTFFAGMEFEYLSVFVIVPWIRRRQGMKQYATIIRVPDPEKVEIRKIGEDDVE